jgi:hypothetical protein
LEEASIDKGHYVQGMQHPRIFDRGHIGRGRTNIAPSGPGRIGQGRRVQGTHRPRVALSKGRIISGSQRSSDTLSKDALSKDALSKEQYLLFVCLKFQQ